jgi:hypothetical protein
MARHDDRAQGDRAMLDALLDEVWIGHVAVVAEAGHPMVLPTLLARDGDRVLLHGSTGSGWMRHVAAGAEVSLAVTAADAIIVARSAYESSMRYRCAVLFGRCSVLEDDEKLAALDLLTEAIIPGRTAEVRRPTRKEIAATIVLALPITEWSMKANSNWPDDPAEDVAADAWGGVLPMRTQYYAPRAAPDLRDGIEVPESVRRLTTS